MRRLLDKIQDVGANFSAAQASKMNTTKKRTPPPVPARPPRQPPRQPAPAQPLQTLAELYAYWSGGGYELINNLWGKDSASSGSQCTFLDSCSGASVGWHTTWTWRGAPDRVKSYPYSGRQFPRGKSVADIRAMPTSVSWAYDTEIGIRANVAYDVFTARDPEHVNSSGDFELMIWLARYDVYPIGSCVGRATVAGRTWDLYSGTNGDMRVFSFLPPPGTTIKSFSADVKHFFDHLEREQGFPAAEQNLIVFQVGTEAFTGGPATFTCHHFSAEVLD